MRAKAAEKGLNNSRDVDQVCEPPTRGRIKPPSLFSYRALRKSPVALTEATARLTCRLTPGEEFTLGPHARKGGLGGRFVRKQASEWPEISGQAAKKEASARLNGHPAERAAPEKPAAAGPGGKRPLSNSPFSLANPRAYGR